MLQGKAAAQGGVAGRVGKHHPGASGLEFPKPFRASLLELDVCFEEIVEAKHESVVNGTPPTAWDEQAERSVEGRTQSVEGQTERVTCSVLCAPTRGQSDLVAVTCQQLVEWV